MPIVREEGMEFLTSTLASSLASPLAVSFSAWTNVAPVHENNIFLFLFKNGLKIPESHWFFGGKTGAVNDNIGVTGSRNLVGNLLEMFTWELPNVKSPFLQILHMDAGDTLELRMTEGDLVGKITFNIELSGLGFD